MKLLVALFLAVLLVAPAHAQAPFDRAQAEREVMALLDDFLAAFNRQEAAAEERTYHFPHYRLASGRMAVLEEAGTQTRAWMDAT